MEQAARAPILDHMSDVSDATRCRVLRLVEGQELTVSELCAVLQLPQSTVSRHLKMLADHDWAVSRRDGTSRFYSMADDLPADARALWTLVREQIAATPAAQQDDRRLDAALAGRRVRHVSSFRRRRDSGTTCGTICSERISICTRCSRSWTGSLSWGTSAAGPAASPRRSRHSFGG